LLHDLRVLQIRGPSRGAIRKIKFFPRPRRAHCCFSDCAVRFIKNDGTMRAGFVEPILCCPLSYLFVLDSLLDRLSDSLWHWPVVAPRALPYRIFLNRKVFSGAPEAHACNAGPFNDIPWDCYPAACYRLQGVILPGFF